MDRWEESRLARATSSSSCFVLGVRVHDCRHGGTNSHQSTERCLRPRHARHITCTHPRGRVIACTLLIKLISTQKTFFLSHLVVTRHLEPIVCCRTKSRFDCAIFPTHHIMCPDDHQDGMHPPCPPQYIFSLCISWPVSRHSEPLIIETRENRLSALVIGQPRPCRRPQSKRKVTTESIEWEMDDN